MSTEKMRKDFEAWARKMSMDLEYRNIPGVGQFYECPRTLLALEAWQASRAAIEVELPEERVARGYGEQVADSLGFNDGVSYCREAIESLGLKVRI